MPGDAIITDEELAAATVELDAIRLPSKFALSQALMPWSSFMEMKSMWRAFSDGVEALIDRYDGQTASLAAALGLPAAHVPVWDALPRHHWSLIGRPDVIIRDGRPRIVDVNTTPMAGLFALNDMILHAHRAPSIRKYFAAPDTVSCFLMDRYANLLRRFVAPDDGLIAISFFADEYADDPLFERWHYESEVRELERLGLSARIIHVEDLEVGPRGMFASGRRVSLVHRFFSPRPDEPAEMAEVARIAAAARSGAVTILTGLWADLISTKATLAALSDESFTAGLSPSLAGRLKAAIPWTRLLTERHTTWQDDRIDLLPWCARNRAVLVLKPALGHSGDRVMIGRETAESTWTEALRAACEGDEPWVVQELVEPDPEDVLVRDDDGALRRLRLPVVYGVFIMGGSLVGAMRRHGIAGFDRLMINGRVNAIPAPVYWTT